MEIVCANCEEPLARSDRPIAAAYCCDGCSRGGPCICTYVRVQPVTAAVPPIRLHIARD